MRVLLVQLPHSDRVASALPFGISNISTAMRSAGCETEFLDILALNYSREEVSDYLSKSKWDMIGISAFSTQYAWAKWFSTEAKKHQPHAAIVMGGPLPTFSADVVLKHTSTDICVLGEGEETIKDVVSNLGHLETVAGIKYRNLSGEIISTPTRPLISDLDSLPFTQYDLFDMDIYCNNGGLSGAPRVKAISMLSSRGCPYKCNFCSLTFKGARVRSVDKIVEEIGLVRDKYGIRGIGFADELALANKKRAYELCEKLKKLKIYWECQGRANVVDLDLLKAMKDAGCTCVGYGIESGSQKILDAMNKKVTVRQNELAITNTIKAGMIPLAQMIYGYPGEDTESINDTINFFKRVKFYPAVARGPCHINLLIPLPGSPLYRDIVAADRIGDEEEYLLRMDLGYYIGAPVVMNLTKFSDDELLANKSSLENRMKNNYLVYKHLHPFEWFRWNFQICSSFLKVEGRWVLIKILAAYSCRVFSRRIKKISRAFLNLRVPLKTPFEAKFLSLRAKRGR